MIWFYRFLFGLPCRPQDRLEIQNEFPEIINNPSTLRRLIYPTYLRLPFKSYKNLEEEFIKWFREELHPKDSNRINDCPIDNCPLKAKHKIIGDGEVLLHMMRIGGFNKPPKNSFFDLVRIVHKNTKPIRRVILTDPYILMECFEDGTNGGLQNLFEYLSNLGLDKLSSFQLHINPSPKRQTDELTKRFKDNLEREFPNITIDRYKPKYVFHDRFYLVEDSTGDIKGVFGPSLNGLASKAIILFGELESDNTMTRMRDWFN
jgi:hypothetical protein